MLSYSLGPLIIAFLFKAIKDEWDYVYCRYIVCGGLILMNISLLVLWGVQDEIVSKNSDMKDEDTKIKSEIGSGFFNKVLIFLLIHKLLSSLSLMSTRYYVLFWKDNLNMSPFWTQLINFITIMLGSVFSMFLTPKICSNMGESLTVVI